MAVCASTLFNNYDDWILLIQWLEWQFMMGVEYIILYYHVRLVGEIYENSIYYRVHQN